MGNIERIEEMESRLIRVSAAVRDLETALDRYDTVREDILQLDAYLGSDDWKSDFAADEAGLLPADLKRGVLSEDGIWNVLAVCRELEERMKRGPESTISM